MRLYYDKISSVPHEYISCIHPLLHIIEAAVVAIGNDGVADGFETSEVVDDFAAEEGRTVFEGWLVDDDLGAFGLDALHHTLDGALAEVVGVALHREAIHSDDDFLLLLCIPARVFGIAIITSFAEHLVGDEVLARAVGLNDGRHHILRHILIVGQQLLRVLGEAIAAVAEGGIVIMCADTRIEANALNDGLRIEPLNFGVRVKFVEIAYAEGEVGISK